MNTRMGGKFSVGNHGDPEPQPPIQRPVESVLFFGPNPNSALYVPSVASNAQPQRQPQQHAPSQRQPQSNNATNKTNPIECLAAFLKQREDKRRYLNQKLNELERSRSGKRQELVGWLNQVQQEYNQAICKYRELRKQELKLVANHNLDEIENQREVAEVIQEMHLLDEHQYHMRGTTSCHCNSCNVNFNRRNNEGNNGGNSGGGYVY